MLPKAKKLRAGKFITLPIIAACLIFLSACDSKNDAAAIKIENQVVSTSGNPLDKAAVDAFLQEKRAQVRKLSTLFSSYLVGELSVDTKKTITVNAMQVPTMLLNGKPLNNDHTIPDMLSAKSSGGVATIFVRSGDDFVRVSTSLKKENVASTSANEGRAVGSLLNHEHPAYKAIMAGNTYTGTATLFGSIYMTEYTPIKDKKGQIIGISFVGENISGDIYMLKKRVA